MTSLFRRGRWPLLALAVAACVAASTMGALGAGAAVRPASADSGAAAVKPRAALPHTRPAAVSKMYATLYFSRSEVTAADACTPDDGGIARLDTTVAPYLQSLRMAGTG